jgi:excisionase family DNA binding protein
MTVTTDTPPLLYTVPEAMTLLRMSRSTFYREVNAGRLVIVKPGSMTTRVTAADLAAYVELLRTEANQ